MRKQITKIILVTTLIVSGAVADRQSPILAIVGSDTLGRDEFRIQLALQGISDISEENLQPLLEHWAEQSLLYQEACRRQLGNDETTRVAFAEMKRQYLVSLIGRQITDTVKITDNELFDYYNRRKLDFSARRRFQYMVLEDEETAKRTAAELARGKDFVTLARERSLDRARNPSAETVLVGRRDTILNFDPLLEDTIHSLPLKKVSPPIRIGGGYWLIKPLEVTRSGETVSFEEVRDYLRRLLELKRKRAVLETALRVQEKKTKVTRVPPKGDTSGFLASVGNVILTQRYLKLQSPGEPELSRNELRQRTENWIQTELLVQEARRLGLGQDETSRVILAEKEREYLIDKLVEQLVERIVVPNTEVFDYFEKHKEEFLHNVRVIHIVVGSESLAQQILVAAQRGADFSQLAREKSYDRHITQGGESRYLGRLDPDLNLDPVLEEVVFSLPPGAISPILRTREGYWLLKVTDRRRVLNAITFEQAQERIRRYLYARKARQVLDELLGDLKQRWPVQFFVANFWK